MSCTVPLLSEIVNTVSMLVTICDMFDAIGIDAVLHIGKMKKWNHESMKILIILSCCAIIFNGYL